MSDAQNQQTAALGRPRPGRRWPRFRWRCWLSLTYQPSYYRDMVLLSREQRAGKAKKFVAQSLQLRNDICNEPTWEAVFTDQEVNAWLAEDLVTHFADQLPPEVNEPRVLFELDRIILAFQLRQGGVESVITVVARPRVPGGNTVELTLEKIRAGILPVPADNVLDRIIEYARYHGVDVEWTRKDGYPVVLIRYTPNLEREDVQLEEVQIRAGQIRLAGRSDRTKGAFHRPTLPSRRVLQSKFPRRKIHDAGSVRLRTRPGAARPRPPVESPPARRGRGRPTRSMADRSPRRSAARVPRFPEIVALVLQVNPPMVGERRAGRSWPATIGASIAQVRKTSPRSSMKSQWTPFQRCSSSDEARHSELPRASDGRSIAQHSGRRSEVRSDQSRRPLRCRPSRRSSDRDQGPRHDLSSRGDTAIMGSRASAPVATADARSWPQSASIGLAMSEPIRADDQERVPGDSQRSLGPDPAARGHDGRPAIHGFSRRLAAFFDPGRRAHRGDVRGRNRLRRLERRGLARDQRGRPAGRPPARDGPDRSVSRRSRP